MNKPIIVAILLVLVALSSGCLEEISTDVYRCDTGSMLYLHSDGTYHVDSSSSEGFHGNYTKMSDRLFLDVGFIGMSFVLMPNGTNYIDADEDNWILISQ